MKGTKDTAPIVGGFSRTKPGPRDRQILQLLVLSLLLIAVGVVIGKVFKSVAKRAYRSEAIELNLNLA